MENHHLLRAVDRAKDNLIEIIDALIAEIEEKEDMINELNARIEQLEED